MIPDSYVQRGKTPSKIYNFQQELAGKIKGEKRDCIHLNK